jgi:hypothetical protein
MRRLTNKPRPLIPARTLHKTWRDPANACRTSSFSGCGRLRIEGMISNAISVPPGNWARKAGGSRVVSSFCKTVPPIVTPQIYERLGYNSSGKRRLALTNAKFRRKVKNARAGALCDTGIGARTGKYVVTYMIPIPNPIST